MNDFTLECCVDSVESAISAEKGGATRLELCSNLIIGGTSPSPSLFKEIKKYVNLPVRVLLRPRFGDFCYTNYEIDILNDEINGEKLNKTIEEIVLNKDKMKKMGENALKISTVDAEDKIYEEIKKLVK